MNKIVYNKDLIIEKEIDVKFCKKFFRDGSQKNKCLDFVLSTDKLGKQKCPYGYACAHGYYTTYCGFLTDDVGDVKLIKRRSKYLKEKNEKMLDGKNHDVLLNIVNNRDYCLIASQTAHDLIHLSGQLKTLIEETNYPMIKSDRLILSLIKEYQRYISSIETYQKNSVSISRKYGDIDLLLIDSENSYWEEKRINYVALINAVSDISSRISVILENVQYEEIYKGQYVFLSLISMQSIFLYRIKYHNITVDEMFGVVNKDAALKHHYNWHKVAKKLANILSYQAKLKNAKFVFDGNTYGNFVAKEDVYLALYILLENSIKYCVPSINGDIELNFNDEDNAFKLSIRNSSNYISENSMKHITEKGFSGENSNNMKSNGIGLFVAKKIFDENNIKICFDFSDSHFIASLTANSTK